MTQKEYIKKLRSRLSFMVSENELDDIVSDMEEVFCDSIADGKSEEQICLSLGSPKEAAKNILSERGVSVRTGKMYAKALVFVIITAVSMYLLWNYPHYSAFIMPFIPLGLLLFIENGKLSGLTEKKLSVSAVVSCIVPMMNIFLFPKLADAVLSAEDRVLFPLGGAITAATAASLVCSVLSVRTDPHGIIISAAGIIASLCIAGLQLNAAFHITDTSYFDENSDIKIQQTAFRARYVNIFITTLFAAAVIVFVISAFRRDKAAVFCMYASMGTLMLLSSERYALKTLDITSGYEPVLSYVPVPLWTEICGMILLSVIGTVCIALRKAKRNG